MLVGITRTRVIAPSSAGQAMAVPVLSSMINFLKIEAKHFKRLSDLGGALTKGLQCSAF